MRGRWRKSTGAFFMIALIGTLLTGCLFQSDTPPLSDESSKITLTPIELFQGSEAKYKPFLGSMTGAFALRYEGAKPNVALDIEVWQDGKPASRVGSMGDLFFSKGEQDREGKIEVILAVDTVSGIEGQEEYDRVKVGIFQGSGSSLATFTVPHDKKLTARALMAGPLPRTLTLADLPAPVWGIQATSTNQIRTLDFSEESLSQMEWGLIYTLRPGE